MINGTQVLFDRTSTAGTEYIGTAGSGVATSAAQWAISKVIYDIDGKPTSITWAEGTQTAINEWDNRTTYNYS